MEAGKTHPGRLKAALFDFGGVIADEGFREGLRAIARKNRLDPDRFFAEADGLIYECGYLTGAAGEAAYWDLVRKRTGIAGTDRELRLEILERFILRHRMLAWVDLLRSRGILVALLSDQTNWLEEINRETALFRHFDRILNSFETHLSKRDASTFGTACRMLKARPEETVFIDDNEGHILRATESGLQTIHFTTVQNFEREISRMTGAALAELSEQSDAASGRTGPDPEPAK